jgi:hypothetical protein
MQSPFAIFAIVHVPGCLNVTETRLVVKLSPVANLSLLHFHNSKYRHLS